MAKDRASYTRDWRVFQATPDIATTWDDETKIENLDDYRQKIANAPYDFHYKQCLENDYIPSSAHVIIDLSATDEQIKRDFAHWLKNYREVAGYRVPKTKAHKALFTQKIFDYWIEFGLIPYLDLILMSKIEGKKITHDKIANLIFPNSDEFSPIERLRDTTKPEAERLIKNEIHISMIAQIASEKATGVKEA